MCKHLQLGYSDDKTRLAYVKDAICNSKNFYIGILKKDWTAQ
jgi:hypothetical protein